MNIQVATLFKLCFPAACIHSTIDIAESHNLLLLDMGAPCDGSLRYPASFPTPRDGYGNFVYLLECRDSVIPR